jgi:IS4 transposase
LSLQQDAVDGQYVVQSFKALKQNLTVKTFVGTSENALRIQIWTALIALLLLKWLHHLSKANWSLSNLASMLRLNLFTVPLRKV